MLKKIQTKLRSNKGFTLIELMIVIAILGVLAAVAIPYYNQYIENSKMRVTRTNYDAAIRTVKNEFSNVNAGNTGAANILAVLNDLSDPDVATSCRNKNPFTPKECAYEEAAAPTTRGVVAINDADFSALVSGTDVKEIRAWITGDAAWAAAADNEYEIEFK